jgi:hypothetical protein
MHYTSSEAVTPTVRHARAMYIEQYFMQIRGQRDDVHTTYECRIMPVRQAPLIHAHAETEALP